MSLWVFSAGVWPQNKPEKQKADVSLVKNWGDQKPTFCAKVGVKFYDNLKKKVEDLGEGKWESEGQSAEGCMKLQLRTRGHMATPGASAGPEGEGEQASAGSDCGRPIPAKELCQPWPFHVGALRARDCKSQGDTQSLPKN